MTPTRIVSTGGIDIATYERGRGAPVVMINGLGASAADWGPLAERLAERARMITFDNRGAGRSSVPKEPFSLERMAETTWRPCSRRTASPRRTWSGIPWAA